jgi:hypothetical protein
MRAKGARARPVSIRRIAGVLDGRSGYRLKASWGHVCILEGGGHICELNLNVCDGVNPLWRPPWKTIDPYKYNAKKHSRAYGPLPDGRLLAGVSEMAIQKRAARFIYHTPQQHFVATGPN